MIPENIKNIKFGCTDCFGEDDVDSIFIAEILPVFDRCGMNENDMLSITSAIVRMAVKAYENGKDVECALHAE